MTSYRRGLLLAVCVAAGCKDPGVAGRPKVVPAGGLVLYKGRPVEGATVTVNNQTASATAFAMTGPDGRFTLTTFEANDGAAPGRGLVAVRKADIIDRSKPGFDYSASNETPPPPDEKWYTPKKYSEFQTSGLAIEVAESGPNQFTFELKD